MIVIKDVKKLIIGLTGGIASGKSTVSKYLQELGAEVVNTDKLNHQLQKKGNKGWKKILQVFGKLILKNNGEINRNKLGKIVFRNPDKLKKLEKAVHPLIFQKVQQIINNTETGIIVLEVPLLFETGREEMVDQIWVVYVDKKTQIQRAKKRDNFMSEKQIIQRINAQIPLEEKKKRADIVIENQGSLAQLKNKVEKIWEHLHEKKKSGTG